MSIVLGENQYGKAENRVVAINRDTARHTIKDVRVGSSLRGDFAAVGLRSERRGAEHVQAVLQRLHHAVGLVLHGGLSHARAGRNKDGSAGHFTCSTLTMSTMDGPSILKKRRAAARVSAKPKPSAPSV